MATKVSAVRATMRLTALTAAATVGLAGASAFAQELDPPYFVRVGAAHVQLADEAVIAVGSAQVPGAGMETDDSVTVTVEIGRTFGEDWAASLTVGVPPTTDISGAGPLAAYGRLGEITYGPMVLAVQRRFNRDGAVQPFLGAGAVYFHVFDSGDGAVQNIEVDAAFGPLVQAGVYVAIGDGLHRRQARFPAGERHRVHRADPGCSGARP